MPSPTVTQSLPQANQLIPYYEVVTFRSSYGTAAATEMHHGTSQAA